MKKTKKQKIESQARREKFLYSLGNLQVNEKRETVKIKKPDEATEPKNHVLPNQDYSYLKKDLVKILAFCAFALAFQIILHLTLF